MQYTLARGNIRINRRKRRPEYEVIDIVFNDAITAQRGANLAATMVVFFDKHGDDKLGHQIVTNAMVWVCHDVNRVDEDFVDTLNRVRDLFGYADSLTNDDIDVFVGEKLKGFKWLERF